MDQPRSLFHLITSLQTHITNFTTNKCEKRAYLGSGCGAVGRAVAYDTRGPGFESSHLTVCRKDENKRKEAGNGPSLIKKKKKKNVKNVLPLYIARIRPLEHDATPITTRPGLPPKCGSFICRSNFAAYVLVQSYLKVLVTLNKISRNVQYL